MKRNKMTDSLVPAENIEARIFVIKDKKVMLDRDLAELYEVTTKVLNQSVKRNIKRFPDDFMFKLTKEETKELVTNCDRLYSLKHSTSTPTVFTEQGVAMLSGILNSDRAVMVNIQIMRTFTKLRTLMTREPDLKRKIDRIEKRMEEKFGQHDQQIKFIFEAITKLLAPPKIKTKKVKKIGYKTGEKK